MTRIVRLALVASCLALAASVGASGIPGSVVDSYLRIHAALAGDKVEGVQAAAKAIAVEAKSLGPAGEKTRLAAEKIAAAADLKSARAAFGALSDAVIELAGADAGDVKKAYCPMVKKYWLQKGEKIENPYYGSEMLRCGEFKH